MNNTKRVDLFRFVTAFVLCAIATNVILVHGHGERQECLKTPAKSDQLNGITIVTDITCDSGGLGCIDKICRYCKEFDTPKSMHLLPCRNDEDTSQTGSDSHLSDASDSYINDESASANTDECIVLGIAEGDIKLGVQAIPDFSCASGGLGCVNACTRYCRYFITPQSSHLLDCSDYNHHFPVPTPTVIPPQDTTKAPLTLSPVPLVWKCFAKPTSGDVKAGVGLMTDQLCEYGGSDCYNDVCRYCKLIETRESSSLQDCPPNGEEDDDTIIGGTLDTGELPSPIVELNCHQTASPGDLAVGISIGTDLTCGGGGIGCVSSICRFCKTMDTSQSTHFLPCTSLVTSNGLAISFKRFPEDDSSDDMQCGARVSPADISLGISAISDPLCEDDVRYCFGNNCRYCAAILTSASMHLMECSTITALLLPSVGPLEVLTKSNIDNESEETGGVKYGVDSTASDGITFMDNDTFIIVSTVVAGLLCMTFMVAAIIGYHNVAGSSSNTVDIPSLLIHEYDESGSPARRNYGNHKDQDEQVVTSPLQSAPRCALTAMDDHTLVIESDSSSLMQL